MRKIVCVISLLCMSLMGISESKSSQFDGRYNSNFDFKMSAKSVCPKQLPIDIEIEVRGQIVSGYIFNNGGGNTHQFCKLYHNGTIIGEVDTDGKFIGVKVRQNDSHSKKYSSSAIVGNLNGELTLISKSAQYHPRHKFKLAKVLDSESSVVNKKTADEQKQPKIEGKTPAETSSLIDAKSKTDLEAEKLAKENAEQRAIQAELLAQLEVERLAREKAEQKAEKLEQSSNTTLASSSSVAITNNANEQSVRLSASSSRWKNASSPEEAQAFANDIQASIVMFMAIAEVIEKQPPTLKDRVLGIVTSEIDRLRAEKELLQQQLTSRFSTPIRPNNANLSVSAFRAADTFPKIPFYVPGTNEIGEMLAVPRITDDGYLQYQFDFLDPTATYDKVRDSISIKHENVDVIIAGLQKVDEWTLVAQENGVTRRVEKTSACIPDGACENKVQGVSSTEVVFQIYEDGSTAGRIQRNKGKFSTGYNMSVESSILLSAYLTYMRDVGSKEFNIGVMTDDEVKDLFK
ncbi:cell envelope integrity protein TolA [Alphaproteobacteria bacterium]|nr:cell envelope integrity protein TolA [Alphaproteobacteria bacterium]